MNPQPKTFNALKPNNMILDLGQKVFEVLVCKLGCHLSSPTCAENFHAQHKHVDSMLGAQQTNESKTDFVLEARSPHGFVDAKHPTVASHLGQKPFKHGTTFAETSSNILGRIFLRTYTNKYYTTSKGIICIAIIRLH